MKNLSEMEMRQLADEARKYANSKYDGRKESQRHLAAGRGYVAGVMALIERGGQFTEQTETPNPK